MCFRRSQVQFSKRYEEGGAAQDNLLPPTLPSRGLHGFTKEETSVQLSGRNAGYDARLLPDRVFQDGLRNLDNAVVNRVQHQLTQTVEPEFAHDVAAVCSVCLRRLHTEIQHGSDFFCTLSLSEMRPTLARRFMMITDYPR